MSAGDPAEPCAAAGQAFTWPFLPPRHNFTEPSDMMGVKVSQVSFSYRLEDAADWAMSKEIRAAYQDFSDQTQAEIQGRAVLILAHDGWMHKAIFQR